VQLFRSAIEKLDGAAIAVLAYLTDRKIP